MMSMLSDRTCPTFRDFAALPALPAFAAFSLLLLLFENRVFMLCATTVKVDPTCV